MKKTVYLKKAQEDMKKRMLAERIAAKIEKTLSPRPTKVRRKYNTYFIQGQVTEKIKIGKSFDPKKRLSDLQVGSPDNLVLLAVLEGDHEKRLHERFKSTHSHGEWYFPQDVVAFLHKKFNQFIQ